MPAPTPQTTGRAVIKCLVGASFHCGQAIMASIAAAAPDDAFLAWGIGPEIARHFLWHYKWWSWGFAAASAAIACLGLVVFVDERLAFERRFPRRQTER